jgi:hypothetical protein
LYCDPIRRHTHCPWASAPHHHPGHRALWLPLCQLWELGFISWGRKRI